MFLSTLGIKEKMLRCWINVSGKYNSQESPEKLSHSNKDSKRISVTGQENAKRRSFLKKWLDDFPKLESHYCRKDTRKLYFETTIRSKMEIYKLYTFECETNKEVNLSPLSYPVFIELLKELNFSIFKPKKDECDICMSFRAGNLSKELYENHRNAIEKMREEKRNDIENAKAGICTVFCMDVQAVKLIAQLNTNASYYKMKLQIHNFTIYNTVTHESDNYIWDETEGNLVSSCFTSCIINHMRNFLAESPSVHHIIIYSDGCSYQNRNIVLSNALSYFCKEKNITMEQKYLISGHTQMECGATHSLIERKIKEQQINLPSQFMQMIQSARRNPFPLRIHNLDHKFFLDFESVPRRYKTIRPGVILQN